MFREKMKEDERLKLIEKTTLEEASIEDILTDDSEGDEEMEVEQGNIIQPEDMDQGLSENEDWFCRCPFKVDSFCYIKQH